MTTLQDIAKEARVSIQTASRILRGKNKAKRPTSAARAQLVHDAARKLGYLPSSASKAMRSNRLKSVGIIISNHPQRPLRGLPSYETILGASQVFDDAGYSTVFLRLDDVLGQTGENHRMFKERLFDGLLVLDGLPEKVTQRIQVFIKTCVWVENNQWQDHNHLRRDEYFVGYQTASHAIEAGYTQCIYVHQTLPPRDCQLESMEAHYSCAKRLEGVQAAITGSITSGAKIRALRIVQAPSHPAHHPVLKQLVEQVDPDTAVITYSTSAAIQILHLSNQLRKRVGIDFGLASCDEDQGQAMVWPQLSRMKHDRYAMGCKAGKMLLKLLNPAQPTPLMDSQKIRSQWITGSTLVTKPSPHKVRQ